MNKVREYRKEKGLAQAAVSVKAKCSMSLISIIEKHDYTPGQDLRARIAAALEVPETDLWPVD